MDTSAETPTGGCSLPRAPLTTTHPHGFVMARPDSRLALVRISKCASSELVDRLECRVPTRFERWDAPVVAFFREPVRRFLSSVPETMLRITYPEVADPAIPDRVVVPEDVYHELCAAADRPMPDFVDAFLGLVEYAFFDAHHEPQVAFLLDRTGRPRLDPHVYLVEHLEDDLAAIAARFGIPVRGGAKRRNVGGAKPERGRTWLRDRVRAWTGTGLYRPIPHPGPLGTRYGAANRFGAADGPAFRRVELNALANRFAHELKALPPDAARTERITRLYAADAALWAALERDGRDRPFSAAMAGISDGQAPASA